MATEKDFQQSVIDLALLGNWIVGFTYDARKSRAGEPDLRMVHQGQGRVVFMELKSETGKLTKGRANDKGTWLTGQDEWAEALEACPGVEYYFFKPSQWDEIVEVLNRP